MPACRSAKDSISVSGGGDWAERALHGARALLACRDVQQRAWFADHTRQAWLRVEPAGLTLDGSGTGCCSLLQLRHCPIGVLQIDRAFVHQLTVDTATDALNRASIVLARSRNKERIAEGVTTAAQAGFLRDAGCSQLQGFRDGEVLPLAEFDARLDAEPPLPLKARRSAAG